MKFRVFEPGRGVVSWHRTETGANRALLRHIRRLFRQGDASHARVQTYIGGDWWPRFEHGPLLGWGAVEYARREFSNV